MKSLFLVLVLIGGCTRDNPDAAGDNDGGGGSDLSVPGDGAMGSDAGDQGMPDLTFVPCASETDCPSGQACNTTTGMCSTSCGDFDQTICNGGCCDGNSGTCVGGAANDNCGNDGNFCNVCGDNTPTCSAGQCTDACSASAPCGATFCCNNGTCVDIDGAHCGVATGGGTCMSCSADNNGHACRASGVCGCFGAGDCPSGMACDTVNHVCTSSCNSTHPCNGGCCSAASNGTCQAGTAGNNCGSTGGLCANCANASTGKVCEAVTGGGKCGCNGNGDCPGTATCNLGTHTCTTACSAAMPCNGGCCAIMAGQTTGTCVAGTANNACGSTGGVCSGCSGGTPTCNGSSCTDVCGSPGNGSCGSGNCCSAGHCVTGNVASACGNSGTCAVCTGSTPAGDQCINGACGCNAATDCPAATSIAAGRACNLSTHTCTDLCGSGSLTGCNGGCCNLLGRCASGFADGACGQSGTCQSCTLSCNTGLSCLSGTSCGCKDDNGCGGGTCGTRNACAVTKTTCCGGKDQSCGMDGDCCSGSCGKTNAGKCDGIPLGGDCLGNAALCTSGLCVVTCL